MSWFYGFPNVSNATGWLSNAFMTVTQIKTLSAAWYNYDLYSLIGLLQLQIWL